MSILDLFNDRQSLKNLLGQDFSIEDPTGPSVDMLRSLPGLTERRSQLIMASIIDQCFQESLSTAIEAPTGVGKSLGYLIPVVLSGKTTVISTSNKELQRQIFKKDVPFVQKNVQQFEAALLKGKNNFLCLKRLDEYSGTLVSSLEADLHIVNGDFEELPYEVTIQTEINGDDSCTGKKCPRYGECYYYINKHKADDAQVIVTNNAMLMADIASGGRVLPAYKHLVLDEAHNLEKDAQNALTTSITLNSFLSLLNRKLVKAASDYDTLQTIREKAYELFNFEYEKDKTVFNKTIQIGLDLAALVYDLSVVLSALKPQNNDYEELADRAENLSFNTKKTCTVKDENVHYVERKPLGKEIKYKIVCVPLDVSTLLYDNLFSNKTVVATSATLATKEGFSFFTKRVGMKPSLHPKSLPPVFNYQDNALLYIPRDVSPPKREHFSLERAQEQYQKKMAQRMQELVLLSEGRAFLLFTSNKMMNAVHKLLDVPYQILKQGTMPKGELLKQFKSEPSVLLAVATFWEGVDVPGDDLMLVAIDKPPFFPPDDPIFSGIRRQIGENAAWNEYSLPTGIIKLKQGVGRLIRTDTDRGVMAILDGRLHYGYGSKVIGSLPPVKLTTNIGDVARFFGKEEEEDLSIEAHEFLDEDLSW